MIGTGLEHHEDIAAIDQGGLIMREEGTAAFGLFLAYEGIVNHGGKDAIGELASDTNGAGVAGVAAPLSPLGEAHRRCEAQKKREEEGHWAHADTGEGGGARRTERLFFV